MNVVTNIPIWLQAPSVNAAHQPAWLADMRQQHWDTFVKQGVPTRKSERWKYTDLAFLAENKVSPTDSMDEAQVKTQIAKHRIQQGESILLVLINGQFSSQFSDLKKLPSPAIVCGMSEALQQHEELIKKYIVREIDTKDYPFAHLNAALFSSGLFIHVPENCVVDVPVHVLSIVTDTNDFISQPQHIVILEKNSQLTLLEEYTSATSTAYLMNIVTSIHAGANSQLQHYKVQRENTLATHMANTFIVQQKDSTVALTNFSVGAKFARDDVLAQLQEAGAECRTAGFYRLENDNQYIDYHITIDHAAPHSRSEMVYKGVLDKKSRAVFNGRLHVGVGAQKIEAHQQNHNLLLSNQAEIYSKPELEIYSDDVKCKHGATTGQLDQDALFYLRARGIDKTDAVGLLLQAFAAEIFQKITHVDIKTHIEHAVKAYD